ncbi:MAG: carbon-nitrogen hydrolase family protein [Proteobacteria bacterium]|nr:carbon-nitrogen hydrolase family protein [Pseudomonadota bacterium]MCP4920997.1 carbon-nitrogen hydrolase family protein [Pseudomonadota bacterium]
MKLAAIQYRPPKGDVPRARLELAELIERAGDVDLVVCPEMATTGYVWDSPQQVFPHTEPADGATFAMLRERAKAQGAWIVCGYAERAPDGLYNAALVVDPTGQLVSSYRKVLLYDADLSWARMGRQHEAHETPVGRMVPGICMDLNDDRFSLHLHRSRADVVAFCTNWIEEGHDILPYWRWRMAGWQGWFVAADSWGEDRGTTFYGRSAILRPGGEVAAMAGPTGNDVLVVDTDRI